MCRGDCSPSWGPRVARNKPRSLRPGRGSSSRDPCRRFSLAHARQRLGKREARTVVPRSRPFTAATKRFAIVQRAHETWTRPGRGQTVCVQVAALHRSKKIRRVRGQEEAEKVASRSWLFMAAEGFPSRFGLVRPTEKTCLGIYCMMFVCRGGSVASLHPEDCARTNLIPGTPPNSTSPIGAAGGLGTTALRSALKSGLSETMFSSIAPLRGGFVESPHAWRHLPRRRYRWKPLHAGPLRCVLYVQVLEEFGRIEITCSFLFRKALGRLEAEVFDA